MKKKINVILGLVVLYSMMALMSCSILGCKKIDHSKDIVLEKTVLERHQIISYREIAPNRYDIKFLWSTGERDSLVIPSSIIYQKFIDRPHLGVFYTYREYRDGTYNFTIQLDKNIYITLPEN